jgi:predicted PurR-regulated permease PerM
MEQRTKLTNSFQIGLTGTVGVLVAIVLGLAIAQTATILTYVGIALFIALGLDPLVKILVRRKLNRALAVTIVVSVFLGAIALLFWAVIPAVVAETLNLIERIPEIVVDAVSNDLISRWDAQLGGAITSATDYGLGYVTDAANWPSLVGGVFQIGVGVLGGLVGVIIVVILAIYFMVSLEGMKVYTAKLVAASKRDRFRALTDQVTDSVGRWVIGQVSVALLHAVLLFIFLSIIRAPFAPLLAAISFFVAVIPLIGSVTSGVISTVVLLFIDPSLALAVAIYYLVYLQLEAYVISPRVMKRAVSVPASLVVIAALMGGTLLGILGAVVAIPLAASVLLIVREVWMPRQQLR